MLAPARQPDAPRTLAERLTGFLRWAFLFAVAAGAILVIGGTLAYRQLDEEIRQHVEQKFRLHYASKGIHVQIGSARRVEGKGIELRDLRFLQPGRTPADTEVAYIGEGFITCRTDLQDLLAGDLQVGEVTVRRLKIRATREADGAWNARRLFPLPQFGDRPPRGTIEQATVEIVDGPSPNPRVLTLREIDVQLGPVAPGGEPISNPKLMPLLVKGSFTGDHFERIKVSGRIDPVKGYWSAHGSAEGVQISPTFRAALPREAADALAPLAALRGRLRLEYRLLRRFDESEPTRFVISGELTEGQVDDPRLPYPLTEIRADVYCDNQGLTIERMTAKSGLGLVELTCHQEGFVAGSPLVLKAKARQLELDARLAKALPPELRGEWNKLQPSGAVHVDLSLTFDGRQWQPNVKIECLNVSLAYVQFPYRLQGCVGTIWLVDNRLTIRLRAQAAGQIVRIEGDFQNPGVDFTGTMVVTIEGPIPIDEALLAALSQESRQAVVALRPRGSITAQARFERRRTRNKPVEQFRVDIALHDCSIKYDQFPYPLDRIRGNIMLVDGKLEFHHLEGHNGSAYITCSGSWTPGRRGSLLKLDFVGTDVPLEEELQLALHPAAQQVWSQARPRGTVDHLRVGVVHFSGDQSTALEIHAQKWKKQQNVEGRAISLEPVWFPYRLDNVAGIVHYKNGEVVFKNLSAVHGTTGVSLSGKTAFSPDGTWRVSLDRLTADRVRFDHDLLAALPAELRASVTKLNLSGPLGIEGALELSGDGRENSRPKASWDATIDVENGGLDCGLKLEHMHGGVRLVGGHDGQRLRTRGELQFDSLVCKDVQLTNVSGPLWIDDSQVVFGARADAPRSGASPRQITAQVYGGTVAADAQVLLGGDGEFDTQVTLSDADLAAISQEYVREQKQLTGKANASVRLSGNNHGTHTWRGGGSVRLRDADIYEVPVMLALLKLVSVRRPNKTAFNNSDIDFRIQGDRLYFDRLDFKGDAITLKGNGEMDLDRNLNLEFYALVGRDEVRVPVLTPMLGLASQQLLLIQVAGTLEHPELNKKAFPGLNDTLKQLFPEAQQAQTWNGPTLVSPVEALRRSGLMRR